MGGAGPDGFDTLIGELSRYEDILAIRDRWRTAHETMMEATNPSELAHRFTQLTCELFFRAVWARIASITDEPEMKRLWEIVSARPLQIV